MIGLIIFLLGIGQIGASMYIHSQVEEGKGKIQRAEKQVDQGESLFSLNPVSKEIGQGLTGSAHKKINEGKEEVAYYARVAHILQISGIIFFIVGLGTFFIGKPSKR